MQSMPLSIKVLLVALSTIILAMGGFIVFKEFDHSRQLSDIQKSVIVQKDLLDGIVRSQAQYASKQDIEAFAKQQNINLDIIKNDLDGLNARVIAISSSTTNSSGQNSSDLPSSGTTPGGNVPPVNPSNPDPYGYMKNIQHLALNEKFIGIDGKTEENVPFGNVSFSAWKDKPWGITIPGRTYTMTSVLGQDDSGRHYSYSKLAIQVENKWYDVHIQNSQFLEEYPDDKFSFFNPKLHMFVNGGVGVSKLPIQGEFTPGLSIGFMSYGKTKLQPTMSILQAGVGYGTINKNVEFVLSPIQYNIGKSLPLISNTYVGPNVQLNSAGTVTVGAGISVGL